MEIGIDRYDSFHGFVGLHPPLDEDVGEDCLVKWMIFHDSQNAFWETTQRNGNYVQSSSAIKGRESITWCHRDVTETFTKYQFTPAAVYSWLADSLGQFELIEFDL